MSVLHLNHEGSLFASYSLTPLKFSLYDRHTKENNLEFPHIKFSICIKIKIEINYRYN